MAATVTRNPPARWGVMVAEPADDTGVLMESYQYRDKLALRLPTAATTSGAAAATIYFRDRHRRLSLSVTWR